MPDAYLLDTNLVSLLWDAERAEHGDARTFIMGLDPGVLYVSAVTFAEIEYGLLVAPNVGESRHQKVRNSMNGFEPGLVLEIGRHTWQCYAELRARLFRKYSPKDRRGRLTAKRICDLWERIPDKLLGIQENDLWLASQAMERDLVLLTGDRMKHIIEVAGQNLRTQKWA